MKVKVFLKLQSVFDQVILFFVKRREDSVYRKKGRLPFKKIAQLQNERAFLHLGEKYYREYVVHFESSISCFFYFSLVHVYIVV